jgi:hypothetical protein
MKQIVHLIPKMCLKNSTSFNRAYYISFLEHFPLTEDDFRWITGATPRRDVRSFCN